MKGHIQQRGKNSWRLKFDAGRDENRLKLAEVSIVDAVLGDDDAAKRTIRAVALLLANNPGWASSADGVHKIKQEVGAAIKTAAEAGK
jgi:hypothetical protein